MWIHEQQKWPLFTYDMTILAIKLSEVRHKQGRLLGRVEGFGFDLRREASLSALTADIVKSSAIEGEILNPEEVRSSIAKRLGIDIVGIVPTSRDVEGIVEIMLDATQNFLKPLTVDRLFDWHAALFPTGRSGMSKITVGDWRPKTNEPMQVISGAIGKEKVHFEAPHASKINDEMHKFLTWFETCSDIDGVIKAGIAHFWFVTIHPFEDGNGRIARAIADMALACSDNSKNRFYSMSAQIENERKIYYEQLEKQQRGSLDITCWLDWFLDCLNRAIDNAEDILSAVLFKASFWELANQANLNQRQKLILNRMLEDFLGHMNTSKYAKIAKCSQDTALRDIRELIELRLLIQNASSGRSTSYRLLSIEEIKNSCFE